MTVLSCARGALVVLAAVAVTGCTTTRTTGGGRVGVDREQTMLVSSAEVDRSAAKAYQEAMHAAQSKKLLNRDAQQTERVRAIARRLIPVTAAFRPDAPGWKWEVNVVSSKELNAWCMPGGKIAVYTGLIEQLQITDDELAGVMGHEIAHALREHGREKAGQAAGLNVAAAIGGALIGAYFGVDSGLGQSVIGGVGDLAFMRPNSREMEQEADRMGVELAARAGYDPSAAISLWEKMGRASGGQPPQWLSTHPSHGSRIADLRVYAQRVEPLYLAARQAR
ncbi:MAG: Metalloprotease LoiP precursor [Candidatus Accumulibacter regalis]|uniref:Metalloprotease LoiP n=1 Tax=Accumulibacter regalis TaxID=522306 RepID=A0A011QFC4_ACCRE|nr:M48 family metallopeptidase [Accumulibacter sp.]EXI88032.1 MAG: Metalloprotease LoiP precursor [Candidatus Accumulibacter regalis]HRE69819.1 M48 family metallopeptidase [Accumulibacter sp.]HRE85843.1 M48 family metallopeptidase [Accumulibacter sp.]HRI92863.1 M48 family metallopeptidase [Accumulibacter sp.]